MQGVLRDPTHTCGVRRRVQRRQVEERKIDKESAIGMEKERVDKLLGWCRNKKEEFEIKNAANVDDQIDRSDQNRGRKLDKHSAR